MYVVDVRIDNKSRYTNASVRRFCKHTWDLVRAELTGKQVARVNYKGARFAFTDRISTVSMINYWFARAAVKVPARFEIGAVPVPALEDKPKKTKAPKRKPNVFDHVSRWKKKLANAEKRFRAAQTQVRRNETALYKIQVQLARAETRAAKVLADNTAVAALPPRDFAARMRAARG